MIKNRNKKRSALEINSFSNENLIEKLTVANDTLNGKPVIRGTRISVQTVLEFLGAGDSKEEILHQNPSLVMEDIDACLRFAL